MDHDHATSRRKRRTPRPLGRQKLDEIAVAYVARFATSAGKLKTYLQRKLRERGWDDDAEPDIDGLVAQFVAKGYVDDESFGRARTQSLLARGMGARRIDQDLRAASLGEDLRAALGPDEEARREAAVTMARRRRFGPFDSSGEPSGPEGQRQREKRLAAMIRAGHGFDAARHVLEAASIEELEQWVADAREED